MRGLVTRNGDLRYSVTYEGDDPVTVDVEGSGRRSQFREPRHLREGYVDARLPSRGTPP